MLLRLIKYFRGYVEVTLWGYAPERFFNLCSNHDILIWDLRRQGDAYDFKISLQGFRCLKPLLKKSGTRVRIRKKSGLPFFFFRYRRRKILFAGIFGCMLVLFALSRFIWKININGNDSVTDDSLLKFLEENHSSYGTYISNVDCTKLEEEIRSSFKNVIWTSVKREGTTLTVDIQENLIVAADQAKAALPDDLKDQEQSGYDLLAVHGGTVESIYVRKGTPLVQKGDTVKKGDVLVSGLLPIYDDSQTVTAGVSKTVMGWRLGRLFFRSPGRNQAIRSIPCWRQKTSSIYLIPFICRFLLLSGRLKNTKRDRQFIPNRRQKSGLHGI